MLMPFRSQTAAATDTSHFKRMTKGEVWPHQLSIARGGFCQQLECDTSSFTNRLARLWFLLPNCEDIVWALCRFAPKSGDMLPGNSRTNELLFRLIMRHPDKVGNDRNGVCGLSCIAVTVVA